MTTITETIALLTSGAMDDCLSRLYACRGEALLPYRQRFLEAIEAFRKEFGDAQEIALFSAPGRTELGGNHTDHQGGHVLAGSVNLDIIAVAAVRTDGQIRLKSEGFCMDCITLDHLQPVKEEENTSASLLRGIAAKFTENGHPVTGFDAYTTSDVLRGSGLSSSAAFEVLVGNICNTFFAEGSVDAVQIAQIGQYAENVYFGKPCGLMDQMACSVGGVIGIDFKEAMPQITRADVDLTAEGYALCILDSGADHADLTGDYAAIPAEMKAVAHALGAEVLSQTSKEALLANLPAIRRSCGDRAVLRALHFFGDDARVPRETAALQNGDFSAFLEEVKASGRSSFMYLQNVSTYQSPAGQEVAVTIALCEQLLAGRGAVRVHGGGFAGTVQAFVPLDMLDAFRTAAEAVLGEGKCHVLRLRSAGGAHVTA
ncbi:MAG: galactokinase [Oscillospiraceae bacterium]|nr:galactokinase [Oscillospiraceae bacterium]